MNPVQLLKADHKAVEGLFRKVEKSAASEHVPIFKQIKSELEAHAWVEESVFYPHLLAGGNQELVELTSEAIQEHMPMKAFLGELDVATAVKDKFEPLLIKLIEDVRHHVAEEENEMFPMAESQFSTEEWEELGEEMEFEKERFLASAESAYN